MADTYATHASENLLDSIAVSAFRIASMNPIMFLGGFSGYICAQKSGLKRWGRRVSVQHRRSAAAEEGQCDR